jgi:hypothetical protein
MNNENKARWKFGLGVAFVSILTLIFGEIQPAQAQMQTTVMYNRNILYINKFNNLVNIKDIINIDYKKYINNNSNKRLVKTIYLINDLHSRSTFRMPDYSETLNLKSRVDNRVFISRLANAIKSQETGGVTAYSRKSYSSSACGAYQYMPTTWNNYMGYKSACHAPAWVQDARVIHELEFNYAKYHDWRKVIAAHLLPCRANDMKSWNKPVRGNPTVQQYVNSVFKKANIALA